MPSILLISFVEWAGAFQRPHHMAMGFARRGWSVTYLSPGYVHRRAARVQSGLELPGGLEVIEPAALPGSSKVDLIARLNESILTRALGRRGDRSWDAIVFNDPRLAAVAKGLAAPARIWDCMDDLSAAMATPDRADRAEREALDVADLVWTGTASLADRYMGLHPSVRFIPCGVEAERFASVDAADVDRARREVEALFESGNGAEAGQGPLAGYFGALNERIDPTLIGALAAEGWRVLLIGPKSSKMAPLPAGKRIQWIGPRPYVELPAYLALMDLALIPYDTRGPHRYLYPVKALEYLAGGVPVLSTPLPDVERFLSDFVLLAGNAPEWADIARDWPRLRDEAGARAKRGREYARSRGWEAMISEMIEGLAAAGRKTA